MLIDHCGEPAAFRPPPVEALTPDEHRQLRETLDGVVESWSGARQIGMQVLRLREHERAADEAADVWFRASGLPLALGLTARAAASLLCVNLGAQMPSAPETRLSEIDRALLDAWASRTLPALAEALGAGPTGEVTSDAGESARFAMEQERFVAAELTFAGEVSAGMITIATELARGPRDRPALTLGDHADLLLQASLTVEATIVAEPVPLPELLSLECGDVLLLGDKTAVEAHLSAGEAVVAAGRPGAREGMRALRLRGAVLTDR